MVKDSVAQLAPQVQMLSPPHDGACPTRTVGEIKDAHGADLAAGSQTDAALAVALAPQAQVAQHAQLVQDSAVRNGTLPNAALGAARPKKRIAPIPLLPSTTSASEVTVGAPAQVAKKRRIVPQSTASSPPAGVAATHPPREPAIERTPEQYLQEVRRDAETIMDTMSRFQSMTATEMLYEDGVDLQSVSVLAQRVFGNMSMFQVYFRARRCEEQDAEDERRATLKPVPIDQGETEIYDKYQSKLTGGNKTLYKCPFADAGCICKAGPAAAGPGLKAIVQRHIDRVHCKTSKKRAELHGLGEAIAEGWVV